MCNLQKHVVGFFAGSFSQYLTSSSFFQLVKHSLKSSTAYSKQSNGDMVRCYYIQVLGEVHCMLGMCSVVWFDDYYKVL